MNVPLMTGIGTGTGTGVSHNPGIPTSKGNLISCVQAGGNRNMFSALAG